MSKNQANIGKILGHGPITFMIDPVPMYRGNSVDWKKIVKFKFKNDYFVVQSGIALSVQHTYTCMYAYMYMCIPGLLFFLLFFLYLYLILYLVDGIITHFYVFLPSFLWLLFLFCFTFRVKCINVKWTFLKKEICQVFYC